jgi:methylthioribose-1-phosphate isomerase
MSGARYTPIRVEAGQRIVVLDQTRLPHDEVYVSISTVDALCEAIGCLRVRGAPLLGLAGMAGIAIAAERDDASDKSLQAAGARIAGTRSTAVDLGAGVQRAMEAVVGSALTGAERRRRLWTLAAAAVDEQAAIDERIAEAGAPLLERAGAVLTHCNTGALATGGRGTALAVIAAAHRCGWIERCYATETRPLLQGARLTTWELAQLGIPHALLSDSAAAGLLASGKVSAVVVGADRIAANGDVANKVGTLGLALAAKEFGVPFYVAAPRSTFDLACMDGSRIPIEFRPVDEVGGFGEQRWAPGAMDAYNPAFDVTPARFITALLTDRGVLRPPFGPAIDTAFGPPAGR